MSNKRIPIAEMTKEQQEKWAAIQNAIASGGVSKRCIDKKRSGVGVIDTEKDGKANPVILDQWYDNLLAAQTNPAPTTKAKTKKKDKITPPPPTQEKTAGTNTATAIQVNTSQPPIIPPPPTNDLIKAQERIAELERELAIAKETICKQQAAVDDAKDQVNMISNEFNLAKLKWMEEREALSKQISSRALAQDTSRPTSSTVTFIYGFPIRKTWQRIKKADGGVRVKEIYIAYIPGNKNIYLGDAHQGSTSLSDDEIAAFKKKIQDWHEKHDRPLPTNPNRPPQQPPPDLFPSTPTDQNLQ